MDLNFKFNHSNLSILLLHQNGIRSLVEIEEAVVGDSFAEEIPMALHGESVFIITGFTLKSKPLKIAFTLDKEGIVITLQAEIASVSDIKEGFCKHCK